MNVQKASSIITVAIIILGVMSSCTCARLRYDPADGDVTWDAGFAVSPRFRPSVFKEMTDRSRVKQNLNSRTATRNRLSFASDVDPVSKDCSKPGCYKEQGECRCPSPQSDYYES